MKREQQTKILELAMKHFKLDCHFEEYRTKKQLCTRANEIMSNICEKGTVYKDSYLYADTLDACFFIDRAGNACCAMAFWFDSKSNDFTDKAGGPSGQSSVQAVTMAREIVAYMQSIIDEQSKEEKK
jgi:hypothetical protein